MEVLLRSQQMAKDWCLSEGRLGSVHLILIVVIPEAKVLLGERSEP